MAFVKSADTSVTVIKSQQDIIGLLQRYGARDFGFDFDSETQVAKVRFRIVDGGRNWPVELRVEVNNVFDKLYAGKDWSRSGNRRLWGDDDVAKHKEKGRQQAQRTAWRLLVDWLDAALSTTTMGIQTVEEVFLAHLVLPGMDGKSRRMVEHLGLASMNDGRLQLQLPSGNE